MVRAMVINDRITGGSKLLLTWDWVDLLSGLQRRVPTTPNFKRSGIAASTGSFPFLSSLRVFEPFNFVDDLQGVVSTSLNYSECRE